MINIILQIPQTKPLDIKYAVKVVAHKRKIVTTFDDVTMLQLLVCQFQKKRAQQFRIFV